MMRSKEKKKMLAMALSIILIVGMVFGTMPLEVMAQEGGESGNESSVESQSTDSQAGTNDPDDSNNGSDTGNQNEEENNNSGNEGGDDADGSDNESTSGQDENQDNTSDENQDNTSDENQGNTSEGNQGNTSEGNQDNPPAQEEEETPQQTERVYLVAKYYYSNEGSKEKNEERVRNHMQQREFYLLNKESNERYSGSLNVIDLVDYSCLTARLEFNVPAGSYEIIRYADGNSSFVREILVEQNEKEESLFEAYGCYFMDGENTIEIQFVERDYKLAEPSEAPVKEKHTFKGWVTEKGGSTSFDFNRQINAVTKVYASWTAEVGAEVKKGDNVPDIKISTPIKDLMDICLTEEEKKKAQAGESITICLTVNNIDNSISAGEKAIVEAALDGYKVGQYLDFTLAKNIEDNSYKINSLDKNVQIVITIPASLKNTNDTIIREFAVIRVHNGEAYLLKDTDNIEDTITIETSLFSTYAIVYKDTLKVSGLNTDAGVNARESSNSARDNEPRTGDNTPVSMYATIAMIAGLMYVMLYFKDSRYGMTEESKKKLMTKLIHWAHQGGYFRRLIAMAAIFVLSVFYHSIGKISPNEIFDNTPSSMIN